MHARGAYRAVWTARRVAVSHNFNWPSASLLASWAMFARSASATGATPHVGACDKHVCRESAA